MEFFQGFTGPAGIGDCRRDRLGPAGQGLGAKSPIPDFRGGDVGYVLERQYVQGLQPKCQPSMAVPAEPPAREHGDSQLVQEQRGDGHNQIDSGRRSRPIRR